LAFFQQELYLLHSPFFLMVPTHLNYLLWELWAIWFRQMRGDLFLDFLITFFDQFNRHDTLSTAGFDRTWGVQDHVLGLGIVKIF
jgi:hypothetical protein